MKLTNADALDCIKPPLTARYLADIVAETDNKSSSSGSAIDERPGHVDVAGRPSAGPASFARHINPETRGKSLPEDMGCGAG
jgi:hypothetical protein